MKLISWNVNGIRACLSKGFMDFFQEADADFFCLQETKVQTGQVDVVTPGYSQYWCYAEKKGYSGTAIFTKHVPMAVTYGLGVESLDHEGRLITLEYDDYFVVTCYTPNAQEGLKRLAFRLEWDRAYRAYLKKLSALKPVYACGDYNVAHCEIDLKNPGPNRGKAGFSDEEREQFDTLLAEGFTDSYRHLFPDKIGQYTWWSYRFHARENNAGWRIDYWLVSSYAAAKIQSATIYSEVFGSDHCPIELCISPS